MPFHAAGYLATRRRAEAELLRDVVDAPATRFDDARVPGASLALDRAAPVRAEDSARSLSFFVSCAERSGETHAVTLVHALRAEAAERGLPAPRFVGLGGPRLADAGVELLARPVERAVMGLSGVMGSLSYYVRMLEDCAERFRVDPPDLIVPVDSPALHVPLARLGRRYGIRSVHFVAPQYWGWAPWRTPGYAATFERALTILPFERAWFERHGVRATHVGHPLLDHLRDVPVTRPSAGARGIAVLCGSRAIVIERNLPWMLARFTTAYDALGRPEIALLHDDEGQRARLERLVAEHGRGLDARVAIGGLHAELARARTAFTVSGTVLLDVLHHRLPAIVLYRLGSRREEWIGRAFVTAPWFSVTNLLAGEELLPEFGFAGEGPTLEVERALVRAHRDEAWRATCLAGLDRAAERLGPPGAASRAARIVVSTALSAEGPG